MTVSPEDYPGRGAVMKRRRSGETGSALLIVFVFAAMIAIMLYMEMPVAVFEARRQKEQLLIDRGNEYKHAVKLFVRKTGTYPPSLDALENTNRIRFLRHKFKDPFTGGDDWRLLHAGPGGQIIDSKVNPIQGLGQNGTGTNPGSSSSFGSNPAFGSTTNSNTNSGFGSSNSSRSNSGFGSGTGFGSSGSSSFGSNSNTAGVEVPPIPHRAPARVADGAGAYRSSGNGSEVDGNGLPPLPQSGQNDQGVQGEEAGNAAPSVAAAGQPGQPVGLQTVQDQPGGGSDSSNPMQAVRNLLNNPNTPAGSSPTQGQAVTATGPVSAGTSGSPASGQINSGGIAGVASKAHGRTIKTINDQTDYALWEFYYDPAKETAQGVAAALPGGGALQSGTNGTTPPSTLPAVGGQSPATVQNSVNQNVQTDQPSPNQPSQLGPP